MKPIQRTLVLSLFPILTAISTAADSAAETITPVNTSTDSEAKTSNSWRASSIIGTNIKTAGGETVGEIKDLYIDLKTQEVVSVIVSSGGFLGLADTLSSVPVSTLRYDNQAKVFKISLSKAQLEKQPQFKSGAWPNLRSEGHRKISDCPYQAISCSLPARASCMFAYKYLQTILAAEGSFNHLARHNGREIIHRFIIGANS